MSAPMVRAILAGTKTQTQTRRAVKVRQALEWLGPDGFAPGYVAHPENHLCPYGAPGDRLWVREAWRTTGDDGRADCLPPRELQPYWVWYEADGKAPAHKLVGKLRPSIHMPGWASRITLEITEVRLERLQDITRGDAIEEGCPFHNMATGEEARDWYAQLWNSINGAGAWDANPWTWVISSRKVTK